MKGFKGQKGGFRVVSFTGESIMFISGEQPARNVSLVSYQGHTHADCSLFSR